MNVIEVDHITKDYGNRRGVFDVSFTIGEGQVFGFLGPNGAGKTTTIRQLLGFIRPDKGSVRVNGATVWGNAHITNRSVGYLPGEINFPDKITEREMLRYMADLCGVRDLTRAEELLERFELKLNSSAVKRMSKGMKQKIGLVCAFMRDPQILILDEPTSGLDPLMQEKFVSLIQEEKRRGKTILMSSHMFHEVESTCDRVAMIRQGELVSSVDMAEIEDPAVKEYTVTFSEAEDWSEFCGEGFDLVASDGENRTAVVHIEDRDVGRLLTSLARLRVARFVQNRQTLEDYFMRYYSVGPDGEGRDA